MCVGCYCLHLKERGDYREKLSNMQAKENRESPEIQGVTQLENPTFLRLQTGRYKNKYGIKQLSSKKISQLSKVAQTCIKDKIEGVAFQHWSDSLKVATIKLNEAWRKRVELGTKK